MSHNVELDVSGNGRGSLIVDGVEIGDVTCGARVDMRIGRKTRIEIDLVGHLLAKTADAEIHKVVDSLPSAYERDLIAAVKDLLADHGKFTGTTISVERMEQIVRLVDRNL